MQPAANLFWRMNSPMSCSNRVVRGSRKTIQRVPLGTDRAAPAADQSAPEAPEVTVEKLDYAFIFAHDAFGADARRFIKTFYPDYRIIEARSLDGMIDRLWQDTKGATDTHRIRLRHILVVSHGNAAGGMTSVSLMSDGKAKFTPPDMVKLQQEVSDGLRKQMETRREDVISRAIDENTEIEIKGCRIGQSEDALEAMRSFFGGEATVTAPTTYQGFEAVQVPGPAFKDKDSAYDALLGSRIDLPEKLVCRSDETKSACIDRNFPNGRIPAEFFVTSDADRGKFRAIGNRFKSGQESIAAAQAESEPLKHRDPSAAATNSSRPSALGQPSGDDALSMSEIEQAAKAILADYKPERAYMLVSLRRAWERKQTAMPISDSLDPIQGLPPESIFGDPNIVGPDASRFPGPTSAIDTFTTNVPDNAPEVSAQQRAALGEDENLAKPLPTTTGEAGEMVMPEDTITATPKSDTSKSTTPAAPAPAPKAAPRPGASANGEMKMPADSIKAPPKMPTPALDTGLYKPKGAKPETALVVRGEFSRAFEIKYEQQLGYLKVKKAVVDFNGKIDFKGEGEKEIVIGALGTLTSKPGESVSLVGDKLEPTLAKGQDADTGVSGKVSGGLNIGGQSRSKGEPGAQTVTRGLKSQVYLAFQVAWGPISSELKLILVGVDETKAGADSLTVLGIDWAPIIVKGDFDLPVTDGTTVKFTGTAKLTISAEPDWSKIAARLAPLLGRQVVTDGAIVAAGATGAAAGGAGGAEAVAVAPVATGLGEIVITSGFAAGIAMMIYSYFKAVEEIEDLKELQRASDAAVTDFMTAYLAHVGIGSAAGYGRICQGS